MKSNKMISMYALLTTAVPCQQPGTFFSQHTGSCFECMPPRQYFNGTCAFVLKDITTVTPTDCPAGQISGFNNICLPCVTCINNLCPVDTYMVQTATAYVCGSYAINNIKKQILTCKPQYTLNITLNLCVSDALKIEFNSDTLALCAMKNPQGCNLGHSECLLSRNCVEYDAARMHLRIEDDVYLARQVDLNAYKSLSFTSSLAPLPFYNGYINKIPQQQQWIGKTFVNLQNSLGETFYNGPLFEGALSLCNLIKAQENTESSFYGNRNVNVIDNEQTNIDNSTIFKNIINPVVFSLFNEVGTQYQQSCKLPGRQLFDFLQSPIFASLYVLTTNNLSVPVPIIVNETQRLHYNDNRIQFNNLVTDTKFVLGHQLTDDTYTIAQQIYLDYQLDLVGGVSKVPILRVIYQNFNVPKFTLDYIEDTSPITAYFYKINGKSSNDYPVQIFKVSWFSTNIDILMPILSWITFAIALILGLLYGLMQVGKYTGNGGNILQQKKYFKFLYDDEAQRIQQDINGFDIKPTLILIVYVLGYIGFGLTGFSLIIQTLTVVQRNFVYINQFIPQNMGFIQLSGFCFSFIFILLRYHLESNKSIIFQDAVQADMTGANAWRISYLVNRVQKLQKIRPYSLGFILFFSLTLLFGFDMFYLSSSSRNYGSYLYSIDIEFMPIVISMIFSVCFIANFVIMTVYNWVFFSQFQQFGQMLSVFGCNLFVFDMPRSMMIIKGQPLHQDTLTPSIQDLATFSQYLHTLKIKQEKFSSQSLAVRIFFGQEDVLFESVLDYINNILSINKFIMKKPQYKITEKKVYGVQQIDYIQHSLQNDIVQQCYMIKDEVEAKTNITIVGYLQRFTDFKTIGVRSQQTISYERTYTPDMVFKRDPLFKTMFGFKIWLYDFLFLNSSIYTFTYWTSSCFIGIFVSIMLLWIIQNVHNTKFVKRTCVLNNITEDFTHFF